MTAMNNNELDHISQNDKRSSGMSYSILVNGALFATPIAIYLEPSQINALSLYLGPVCGLIVLAKACTDKLLNRSQKMQYIVTFVLSIFISIVTLYLQIGIGIIGSMR